MNLLLLLIKLIRFDGRGSVRSGRTGGARSAEVLVASPRRVLTAPTRLRARIDCRTELVRYGTIGT